MILWDGEVYRDDADLAARNPELHDTLDNKIMETVDGLADGRKVLDTMGEKFGAMMSILSMANNLTNENQTALAMNLAVCLALLSQSERELEKLQERCRVFGLEPE